MSEPLLGLEALTLSFVQGAGGLLQRGRGRFTAVDGVSFGIGRGECLGLIGESGSGKTTLGRAVVQLIAPSGGQIRFDGTNLTALPPRALRVYRPRLQIVFQDPTESMNPRFTVEEIVTEPLRLLRLGARAEWRTRALRLLRQVGLTDAALSRPPGHFSGGQRQRIAIARALVTEPELIVLDEPTSGLDVSMQARILNLLRDLQGQFGLSYLFISHDVGAVSYLAARVAVLYRGVLVEIAPTRELIARPAHPYTAALLGALPQWVRGRDRAAPPSGAPPVSAAGPIGPGCPYAPRCPRALERCRAQRPERRAVGAAREVACHNPLDGAA
jgi:oligopeptide/dipeptide ABC transporter ATP-binding protein